MSFDSRENHATIIHTERIPFSRGRQPNRSHETQLNHTGALQVPLRYVNVPNSQHIVRDATSVSILSNRTPSVPDFASYHVQQQQSPPHLSGEALLYAVNTDPMEQFEGRLRRAQLTVLQSRTADFESATRLRSRSTPSRGAVHRMRSDDNMRSNALRLQRPIFDGGNALEGDPDGSNNNDTEHRSAAINAVNSIENTDLYVMVEVPAPQSFITDQSHSSHTTPLSDSGTNNTQLHHNRNPSSCFSSSSPAHRIPSPPPLPPPSSERERLVLREREARSESERARRRHLALLRERQLNENHMRVEPLGNSEASVRNNDRPTSVGSLDVVQQGDTTMLDPDKESHPPMQFCDIEVPLTNIPQCSRDHHVGENTIQNVSLRSDSVVQNKMNHVSASVGSHLSDISEHQTPQLSPPATEREILVMRERDARLETERARRCHISVPKEQVADDDEMISHGNGNDQGVLGVSMLHQEEGHNETTVDQGDADTNNNLSYTMERFLETLGDEEANANGLNVNETDVNTTGTAPLPYTMELFLSDNATLVGSNDDADEVDAAVTSDDPIASMENEELINLSRNEEWISNHAGSNSNESVEVLSEYVVMPPNLDARQNTSADNVNYDREITHFDSNTNTTNHAERQSLPNTDFDERYVYEPPPTNPIDNVNFSIQPPNDGIPPLHESTDNPTQLSESFTPQMPRLTEEGVAQLTEVDHASIGNAPPMSVRDEPSESSLPDIGPFRDHGFSVATQTTAIESVTETSHGSVRDASDLLHQRSDSASDSQEIIRLDNAGNYVRSNYGTSCVSVMAMPSIDSAIDSDSDRHILSNPSSSETNSSPSVLESNLSLEEESQILSLTEEGVVTMQEIDDASIGNEPPRSIRDESASESSVVGRGRHNSRSVSFSMFRTPSSGLGDTLTANASVEAMPSVRSMSEDSVDVMASGYTRNLLHEDSNEINNEDLIVGQGSSDMASIEALPSIADPFDSSIHNENNEARNGDLVYSGSDRRDNSTSIEALHSDDDLSSTNESAPLNGFHQNQSLQDNFIDNNTEGTPLLALRNGTNANDAMHQQTHSTSQLPTVLLAFATGCFIGLGVGLFLFRYLSTYRVNS